MFFPVVSPSVLKHFFTLISKVETVSASVRDFKSTLPTPQANFLKKQFSYNRFSFSVYLNTEIEFNFTPSNWHFFSPVSKGYLCWVCYDANKQLKSGYKFKGGKCSVYVSSTKP